MQMTRLTDLLHNTAAVACDEKLIRHRAASSFASKGCALYLCSPVLETALQTLNLANLDLNLPAQLLILGRQVLEIRCALVRILQKRIKTMPPGANRK